MKKIKYLIMDVDGTLTDGKIYYTDDGELFKSFNIKDGYGIAHLLKDALIEPIVITGRKSAIVEKRCKEIGINTIIQGRMDKLNVLKNLIETSDIGSCAYIGDDIPDMKCMKYIKEAGGIIGCPSDAAQELINIVDYVCKNKAGEGAVREFIDLIIKGIIHTSK
ncbi:MAG: 3-deoxy-D-manno-octulosonate 8-phosphate phosphatase [Lachnospiraceae bacterium]|nr:3-deoxy-D-manno-octulosonate 8-phosphate phosphatase [Lachnospiraceae bacterium]